MDPGASAVYGSCEILTLNLRAVPGCWAAVNPDAPNRELVAAPPNGLEAVFVDPNRPPLLVLVPNAGEEARTCGQQTRKGL